MRCRTLNTTHALPRKVSKSSGGAPSSGYGAPGSGAPDYGRTWTHLIAFSRCGLNQDFFRVTPSTQLRTSESTKKHPHAPFSLASSTARRSAVRYRAVSCPACGAVLCSAVPCCAVLCSAFSFVHTRRPRSQAYRVGESQHVCPRAFYTAVLVCTSMYVVEPRAKQSTAQHSRAIPPAQSSKPSTCPSEYV